MNQKALVERLVLDPGKADPALNLAGKSADYISRCALKQEYSRAKSALEDALSKTEELEVVDADKFTVELVRYCFENRDVEIPLWTCRALDPAVGHLATGGL